MHRPAPSVGTEGSCTPTASSSGITDGDGKGVYKDGTDGVTAVIELCAVGKDATLNTGNRKMTFALLGIGAAELECNRIGFSENRKHSW